MRLLEGDHPRLRGMLAAWLLISCAAPATAPAKPAGFHPPQLEQAIGEAGLVLVARVAAVSEDTLLMGGKAARTRRTYDFEPVRSLKGHFARELLSLTSDDLGDPSWVPEVGELRLMLLGRSRSGYRNVHRRETLDRALPLVASMGDPLVRTVELLITLTQEPDRARKVELLLQGLETAEGRAAIPLLDSLAFRWLLAAQNPEVASVTRLFDDPVPDVRAAAVRTLGMVLEADYRDDRELADRVVTASIRLLETAEPFLAARVAAFDAIGAARADVAAGAAAHLRPGLERSTWAEQAAVVRAVGQQRLDMHLDDVRALAADLRLDAPHDLQTAVLTTLASLDPRDAAQRFAQRIEDKRAAGLDAVPELQLAGVLPARDAVSLLLAVPLERLRRRERIAFVAASAEVKDERLVPALAQLLNPRDQRVHRPVSDALRAIDTRRAAEALRPHLARETSIGRKLVIAEFLARHELDAGTPYALEHMSEARLLEPAIAVFAAVASPGPIPTLREIASASNDTAWTGAAIRALAALGDASLVPRLLEIVADLRHPLAPYALVALGELGDPRAVEVFREGIGSRDDRVVTASVRGTAALLAHGEIDDPELRESIASLLASAAAALDVRAAALDALVELGDPRLDAALGAAVLDASLETTPLLDRIEELLVEREVVLPQPADSELARPTAPALP